MVKIKNFKDDVIDFSKINTPAMIRCKKYIENAGMRPEMLYPPIRHKVSFELYETTVEFANTIRKCLLDELSIKSMTFDDANLSTDDRYILSDFLKKNIESIPISQTHNNLKISLHKENHTNDIISVYSHDISIQDAKTKKSVNSKEVFAPNVVIISLQPGKFIDISNIDVVEGITYTDACKFAAVSAIEYEILDMVPLQQMPNGETIGASSLVSNPSHIRMGFTTYGNITPKALLAKVFDVLTKRINLILDELKKVSSNSYFSDKIKVEYKNNMWFIYIDDEFWSIGRLLAKYAYLEDSQIPFITAGIIHPNTNKCYLKIKHADPIKVLKNASAQILTDLKIIKV